MTQPDAPEGPSAPAPDAGGGGFPDGPVLPDAAPQAVHDLVNGVFATLGGAVGGIADLAQQINGALGGEPAATAVPLTIDLAVAGVLG